MTLSHDVYALPTFAALDSYAVLTGRRRGTSIQLDETYFTGQLWALRNLDTDSDFEHRTEILEDSRRAYDDVHVAIDELTEQALWETSQRFREQLQAIPEISYLTRNVPGRCFVVPEWLRTGNRLHYGARVYLFGDEDPPDPEAVLRENIESIVNESFDTFERYQGQSHGYPDCCIDYYQDRTPDSPSPEWRSVEPFTDRIRDAALGQGPAMSIDDVVSTFLDREDGYAFFAREFFPEPGCETATAKGRSIYEELSSALPESLVRDYFRLNFGTNYLVARAVHSGRERRPSPGELGREHLLWYAPLREALAVPRYT